MTLIYYILSIIYTTVVHDFIIYYHTKGTTLVFLLSTLSVLSGVDIEDSIMVNHRKPTYLNFLLRTDTTYLVCRQPTYLLIPRLRIYGINFFVFFLRLYRVKSLVRWSVFFFF